MVNGLIGSGCGKDTYGHEIIETNKMPTIIALLILYAIRMVVKSPPQKIPIHS